MKSGFGIRAGVEPMAKPLKFAAQFPMVVDLTIEDDRGVAIIRGDGLVTEFKIDNS